MERHPKRRQVMGRKQTDLEELVKKKKKINMPPPCKGGGISFREPSAHRRVITDWSDDDEDGGETL